MEEYLIDIRGLIKLEQVDVFATQAHADWVGTDKVQLWGHRNNVGLLWRDIW